MTTPARLLVVRSGIFTTVQDLGRYGYQAYGVPVSGVMDWFSAEVANRLVGNPPDAALLEITLGDFTCRFLADAVVAVTGAPVRVELSAADGTGTWRPVRVAAGAELSLRREVGQPGMRTYLAVAGGIGGGPVLGSRSTFVAANLGPLPRPLRAGEELPIARPVGEPSARGLPDHLIPHYEASCVARVVMGPQEHRFSPAGRQTFLGSTFRVTPQSDRTGFRLEGPKIEHSGAPDIISDPVTFGSIQVPGSGQPVLLMADRRVTGGYAKIATVISADLPRVAQLMPGSSVSFKAVCVDEAAAARREMRSALRAAGFA